MNSQPGVELTRLDNGLTIVSHAMPRLETVAIGIWVAAGARDEAPGQNGIAHLLEHMAFKGTSRRSARQIAEEIEAAGGDINAGTSMESTSYHCRTLAEDWLMALDVLCDILVDPKFDANELDREKQVVLQEIAAARDAPDDLVFDLAQTAAYADHPLGRDILGEPKSVAAYGAGDIIGYRDQHYFADRMVISAAGRIDHAELVAEVKRRLGDRPRGAGRQWLAPVFQGGLLTRDKPLDQTHIVVSYPTVGYCHADIYVLQIYSSLLGGGMSSRLFQEIREELGLCYAVFSFASPFRDCGLLSIYAATGPEMAEGVLVRSGDILRAMCEDVSESELARAKAQFKASLVMSLESASARADQIARQYMAFGKVTPIADIVARIDAVTLDDVARIASKITATKKPAVAIVGDTAGLRSFDHVAKLLSGGGN